MPDYIVFYITEDGRRLFIMKDGIKDAMECAIGFRQQGLISSVFRYDVCINKDVSDICKIRGQ